MPIDGNVQAAASWVSTRLEEEPTASRGRLIDEAARKFGLSPLQAELLYAQVPRPTTP
jgi:hypothetical protein